MCSTLSRNLWFGCLLFAGSSAALLVATTARAEWQPAKSPVMTKWYRDVKPDKVHPEYPRPQLVRKQWANLNGLWQYALTAKDAEQPQQFDGEILVPFPVESALSGVMKRVDEKTRLWYRRTFAAPEAKAGERVLLHFGAVDWESKVWVNGKLVGQHRGGYDPFTLDITQALKPEGDQEIVVAVWDPTDKGPQPRGKQVQKPGGIYYTPSTGIWQTVWLETVPAAYIGRLKITPDVDKAEVRIEPQLVGAATGGKVWAKVFQGKRELASAEAPAGGSALTIKLDNPRLWSPEDPFLYWLKVGIAGAGGDAVDSYFGMRKIALGKDPNGVTRMMLNGKPLFQHGLLDQGFWPDGLYTAPTDEALRYDIEITRRMGFNMARKHVKVEPERWYYWCDKLGLLVWQDMPSGDKSIGAKAPDLERSPESARQYEQELRAMIDTHANHPSIVMWVPFNEGWGQFDTARITRLVKEQDPTRLVDCASGWADRPVGDVHDIHSYPGPSAPQPEEHRAAVLGEFGGLGLPVKYHTWQSEKNWGYKSFTDDESLNKAVLGLMRRVHPLIESPGLSAAVYTQTTDVEVEVNGLLTYDRAIIKPDVVQLAEANRQLYLPAPKSKVLLATSKDQPHDWHYTTTKPADDWFQPEFSDSAWPTGPAGFGTANTPGTHVRTRWNTPDIWLRRTFDLASLPAGELAVNIHHDEDAEVYLNGVLAAKVYGYQTQYESLPAEPAAAKALRAGKNVLAVHCHQTTGGQYIDVGLDEIERAAAPAVAATADGWQPLFDGKSLRGWQPTPFGGHGEVEIEDGAIVLKYGEPLTGVTYTGEVPKIDYEIELDAKRVDGADFFCGLTFPIKDDPCSLIIGGWGGGVVGISSLDDLDAANNDTTKYLDFDKGRWYHIRLRVTAAKIEAWIDKEQVVDVDLAGKRISIRREVELSRPLGVASYMTTAALKNLRIKRIETKTGTRPAAAD